MAQHIVDAAIGDFLNAIAEKIAEATARLNQPAHTPAAPARRNGAHKRPASPMRGRKLDMHCRWPGCKDRSKGPRMGFMCDAHAKEPKRLQAKAREDYKAAHA